MLKKIKSLPQFKEIEESKRVDWLLDPSPFNSGVFRGRLKNEIVISNHLVSRHFVVAPNGCTIDYVNLRTGESLLRGIKEEARIRVNNQDLIIGGLEGQVEYGYFLEEWLPELEASPKSFQLVDFSVSKIKKRFQWKKVRHHSKHVEWPPKGVELVMEYVPPETLKYLGKKLDNIKLKVHYECYDGIPLISKWISIENGSSEKIHLDSYVNEVLALVESHSHRPPHLKGDGKKLPYPHIYFEYDYAFGGAVAEEADHITHWVEDEDYTSQVAFLSDSLVLKESFLELGPAVNIKSGETFEGYREYQLVETSYDRQRQGLARCRMYRTLAPWITESPIMMHLTTFNPKDIKLAIKQMKEVGFEMLIFSFGSGFNTSVLELGIEHMDWVDDMVFEIKKEVISAIHEADIEVGGYSLLASRKISEEDDVVNPYTGKTSNVNSPELEEGIDAIQGADEEVKKIRGAPMFGNSPCLGSDWGQKYFESLYKIIEELDLDILEHDGSYPGDVCASKEHPGHNNLEDSQWMQWKKIVKFYRWCKKQGVYLNVPDWYMLNGSNRIGIGYKEVNWSLPRDRQVVLGRQNIYDGTWEKTPTMGWTFTPLTQYHSVEEYPPGVATLEPLSEHLKHYEAHLAQNFGSGVQACYRGFRLYDDENSQQLVKKYVDWYKKYREILESDIVHIRRPDGRHIDGILHVNPKLEIKGLAMFYNPTDRELQEIMDIPLYYTGISEKVKVREKEGEFQEYKLDRDYSIYLKVHIPPKSHTWFVFT